MTVEESGVKFFIDGLDRFVSGMKKSSQVVDQLNGAMKMLEAASDVGGDIARFGRAVSAVAPEVGVVIIAIGALLKISGELGKVIARVVIGAINAFIKVLKTLYSIIRPVIQAIWNFVRNIVHAVNPIRIFMDLLDRITYISLGILVADVFRSLSRGIADMAKAAFKAASDFQLLQLRLQGLIARDIAGTMDEATGKTLSYAEALKKAAGMAKDVYTWIVKVAVTTPFTVEDITNLFTLGKAYGITTDMMKTLTLAIGDFTAGMGLTSTVSRRVIENMGQMIMQGKITGTELRDLARGAYVPNMRILEIMGEKYGKTAEEMRAMAKAGEVGPMEFIGAFIQMAQEDFPNAMDRMSSTLYGVISNIQDFVQAILGFRVLGPALDTVSKKLAELLKAFMEDPRTLETADKIGVALKDWVENLWPDQLNAKSIMDKIFEGFKKLEQFFTDIRGGNIVKALETLGAPEWVTQSVDNLLTAYDNIKTFFDENGDALIEAINRIAAAFGMEDFTVSGSFVGFTDFLKGISQWLLDHQDEIVSALNDVADAAEHFVTVTLPMAMGEDVDKSKLTLLDRLVGLLGDLARVLWEVAGNAYTMASTFTQTVTPSIERLADAWDRIATVLGAEGGGKGMGTGVARAILNLNKILAIFAGLMEAAAGAAERLADNLERIKDGLDKMRSVATEGKDKPFSWEQFGVDIQNFFSGLFEILSTLLSNGFSGLLPIIDDFKVGVINYFNEMSDEVVGHSIVPDMMDKINSVMIGGFEDVLANLGGLVKPFEDMGYKIMQGLHRGLKRKFNSIMAWAQRAFAELADLFANINQLHSPSRLFEKYGRDLMAGLAKGIRTGIPAPALAIKYSAGAVAGQVRAVPRMVQTSIVNNYHFGLTANYTQTQSPAQITSDVEALLAMVKL